MNDINTLNTLPYTISIEKGRLADLPRVIFNRPVEVVDTLERAETAVKELLEYDMVGFDTETRPAFQKGRVNHTALMQVATDGKCYLFRLNKIGLTEGLKSYIENPAITKIGLSLHDDFNVLSRDEVKIEPQGFMDLQNIVKHYHISDLSLQKIYAILFDKVISKHQRLTNWEADTLTVPQQNYAALDAWACLEIYRYLVSGSFDWEQSPYKKYPTPEAESSVEERKETVNG